IVKDFQLLVLTDDLLSNDVQKGDVDRMIRRWRYNLILAKSKFKNPMLDHQDKFMMKAQVHVSKSFAISDEQALPQRKRHC
nr:hypothetical protein [Tanacetum cinerariifolium]